jgi:phage baseplate assembly protein gpV
VIVYYFGIGKVRTVVALRSLGPGPFTISSGTVVKYDKAAHTFSIRDKSGAITTFNISSDMVVETSMGAAERTAFQPANGDPVRVTSTIVNGSATALFINTLVVN